MMRRSLSLLIVSILMVSVSELQEIENEHPDIAKVYNLGELYPTENGGVKTTWQGRYIWAIKISDEPEIEDESEPEFLYMATYHAREIISTEVMMYFLNYLVNNYGHKAEITYFINTREIWMVLSNYVGKNP